MKYYQTDKEFNININKYGCLFFSLMRIAEQHTEQEFKLAQIHDLYNELVDKRIMRNDCYVLDHQKVLQNALEVFHNHDKVTYAGAVYNNFITDRKSWGEHDGMYMILQFKTALGHGHFRTAHYDPYQPLINFKNLISLRFYNIGI